MRVPVGGMDQNNDPSGKISFVNATATTTTYSYIQFTEAKQYKLTLLCTSNPMSSGTLSSHRMSFFNITSNSVIHDTLVQNTTTQNTSLIFNMQFIFTPTINNAYTFVISPSVQNFNVYPIQEFDLYIEEVFEQSLDTYYFNSGALQSFKFENQSSGNVAINLKNTITEWRI